MNPVDNFFNKLRLSKKPAINATDKELFWWAIKHYASVLYFVIMVLYLRFLTFATRYFPFSFLYKDKLFHYDNRFIRKWVDKIEKVDPRVIVLNGDRSGHYYELEMEFRKKIINMDHELQTLEKLLQKKFNTQNIYVRKGEDEKGRILIPQII